MPWNSSKSGINFNHASFLAVRPALIQLVSYYSKVSRRTKDDWPNKIYKHAEGNIEDIEPPEESPKGRLIMPNLPRGNRSATEDLVVRNATQVKEKPWTLGLLEAVSATRLIERQKLQTRSRLALIVLDSNLEIAFKEFIVHRTDLFPEDEYTDGKIRSTFSDRRKVIEAVISKIDIPNITLDKIRHYYILRNKLIHERATISITDKDVEIYRVTVQEVLRLLFGLTFPRR